MPDEKPLPKCLECGVLLACPCCEAVQLNECVECGSPKWCITCDEDEVREIIEPLPLEITPLIDLIETLRMWPADRKRLLLAVEQLVGNSDNLSIAIGRATREKLHISGH